MSGRSIVPVVITHRSGEPDMVSAFEIAERAQKAKIAGWAESFDFELTDPVIVDMGTKPASDKVVNEIIGAVGRMKTEGVVAASTEYLRSAGLFGKLPEALKNNGKQVWIADLGSLPLEERISA